MSKEVIKLSLGPILYFLILWFGHFKGLSAEGQAVLAATCWMALWWTMEAVPIAITALLPLILFPLSGVMSLKITGATYGHPIVFLFIGGFMIAAAIERWNLHSRVALSIISKLGSKPKSLVLGFMLATAFLSMWISNTATTIMMIPIGIAIIQQLSGNNHNHEAPFAKALLLGIAYSASIGGIATLIGTPTNVIFVGVVFEHYGVDVSFAKWMLFATPITLLLLFCCWYYLVNIAFKLNKINVKDSLASTNAIQQLKNKLGPISYEEKTIIIVFSIVAFCWITRSFLLNPFIPNLSDPMIAILGSFALFIIPTKQKRHSKNQENKNNTYRETILDWQTAVKIPWGIILLFGGGLSIAKAFNLSGLAIWIGLKVTLLGALPLFVLLLIIISAVNFLTEVTSNIATVSMILPVLASFSTTIGVHPYILMIGATCAASCAFMLPVATAPNAIVFGSGLIRISDMVKAGLALNILSIIAFTLYIYFIMPLIFLSLA